MGKLFYAYTDLDDKDESNYFIKRDDLEKLWNKIYKTNINKSENDLIRLEIIESLIDSVDIEVDEIIIAVDILIFLFENYPNNCLVRKTEIKVEQKIYLKKYL